MTGSAPRSAAAGDCASRRSRRARRSRAAGAPPRTRSVGDRRGDLRRRQSAGEDNRDVARMAVLLAGCRRAPGTTVNRLCGSSLDAAMQASRMAETGDAWCVLVGGVESMSRAGGAAQARARVRDRRSDAVFDDPGMADGQPEDARGVDDLARGEHREGGRAPWRGPRGAVRVDWLHAGAGRRAQAARRAGVPRLPGRHGDPLGHLVARGATGRARNHQPAGPHFRPRPSRHIAWIATAPREFVLDEAIVTPLDEQRYP